MLFLFNVVLELLLKGLTEYINKSISSHSIAGIENSSLTIFE